MEGADSGTGGSEGALDWRRQSHGGRSGSAAPLSLSALFHRSFHVAFSIQNQLLVPTPPSLLFRFPSVDSKVLHALASCDMHAPPHSSCLSISPPTHEQHESGDVHREEEEERGESEHGQAAGEKDVSVERVP